MMKKKAILIGALVASLGAGALGIGTTFAAEAGNKQPGFVSDLVTAISNTFDLDPAAVQQVFDDQAVQHRDEMRANREQKFEDRLSQAVTDGKITQDQADLVLAKHEEMQADGESLKDMAPAEREAAMKQRMETIKDWAKENNIPIEYLRMGQPPRNGHGSGNGMNHPNMPRPEME